ncbi:hypothetical protein VT930_10135 [Mycobacterium sherrisii]|nr:hypothetical protein [Mycobacterium sherrisii]MEC4763461.1 hypothetical protein [Mycobacterium sherrisii]
MGRRDENVPDDTADDDDVDPDAPVVPEAGEGPYPPVTGEPKPPIGN